MKWRAGVIVAVSVAASLWSHVATALVFPADDTKGLDSPWTIDVPTHLEVSSARPWPSLPVEMARVRAGVGLPLRVRLQLQLARLDARVLRSTRLQLLASRRFGPAALWAGAREDRTAMIGSPEEGELRPMAAASLSGSAWTLAADWMPHSARTGLREAVGFSAQGRHRSLELTVSALADRWGQRRPVRWALSADVHASMRGGLVWHDETTRAVFEFRAASLYLRVGAVLTGPRVGARALALGWER